MNSTKQSILFHKRSITDLLFHPDGDVLFAASKDCTASMINLKGEIISSFEEHTGSLSTLTASENLLVTAGLDFLCVAWDLIKGVSTASATMPSVLRGLDISNGLVYFCSDSSMDRESFVGSMDPRMSETTRIYASPVAMTRLFCRGDRVFFSTIDGHVGQVDTRNPSTPIQLAPIHRAKITSLRPSACRTFFVTASKDCTVKVVDSDTFSVKKRFECDDPINSACIFRTNDKLVAGGGIDARDVTTTVGKDAFETGFYDVVTQSKIGSYTTHFGTINAVDVHPRGTHYISGGEDGSVCLVQFGNDFYQAPFTKFDI